MNRNIIIAFLYICCIAACKPKEFSIPPNNLNQNLAFSIPKSIAQLTAEMGNSGNREIKEPIILSGKVLANDRSGNLYRQIIIDDGSGAIALLLDAQNLFNDFPIGRKVYVRCQGLWTGFYYKIPQLGYQPNAQGFLSAVPFLMWDNFILKAGIEKPIEPISVRLDEIIVAKKDLFNRLIRLSGLQFADTNNLNEFAVDPDIASATNKSLMDCDSNTITLRTSGFAHFRAAKAPKGKGQIIALYSVYNNSPQLILRDTNEITFNEQRCY